MSSLRYGVQTTHHARGDTQWTTWDVIELCAAPIAECPTRCQAELIALALNQSDVLSQGVTA